MTDGAVIDLLIQGILAGLALALGVAISASRLAPAARVCGVMATLAYGLNALANSPARALVEPWPYWTWLAAFSGMAGGLVWVMVLALFDDRPVRPPLFIPAGIVAAGAWLTLNGTGAVRTLGWWLANGLGTFIFLHALYVLARGRAGDLVESRRRLRRPLVMACIAMATAQVAAMIFAWSSEWVVGSLQRRLPALGEMIAMTVLMAALLELRRPLFEHPPVRAAKSPEADEALIIALDALMGEQEAWREEGLGIGVVAARLGTPEHRLRRLINGRLGYRNFPAFVNGYRIEAAKRRFADPADTGRTVAEIAFELGFTSLSPFNRAFKEATGETPKVWRRRVHTDGK